MFLTELEICLYLLVEFAEAFNIYDFTRTKCSEMVSYIIVLNQHTTEFESE